MISQSMPARVFGKAMSDRGVMAHLTSSVGYGLRCPGKPNANVGFVVQLTNPNTEVGPVVGVPGLWTNPPFKTNGIIQGYFPALLIQSGDRFSAQVGCLFGNAECNVTFDLRYQVIIPPNYRFR